MTQISTTGTAMSLDVAWLRRFWGFSAATLAAATLLALVLATQTGSGSFFGTAFVLAAFGTWLAWMRTQVRRGEERRYLALAWLGQYVLMVALLALQPDLASAIVAVALVPLFVASSYVSQGELTRLSIGVWLFCAVYSLMAFMLLVNGGVTATEGAVLVARFLGGVAVVAFMLALLRRYAMSHGDVEHLALHDGLTGVANRRLFIDRLEHALKRARRFGGVTAIMYLDVDGLKVINDAQGHDHGDAVLQGVARRIAMTTRSSDTTARVGGDEFAILFDVLGDPVEAQGVASRLRQAFSAPIEVPDGSVPIQLSMGLASTIAGADAADVLLRNADDAMYESKRQNRGELVIHRPAMRAASTQRQAVKRAFRGVVERGELRVQFQPVVALNSGHGEEIGVERRPGDIVAVEALIRWQDPDRGTQMPADFVSLAEETGDIVPIGRWVMQETADRLVSWRRSKPAQALTMTVNVSGRQLQAPGFAEEVSSLLADFGLPPSSLTVEIPAEAFELRFPDAVATLQQLGSSGVRIAIDDFAGSLTALGALREMRIDLIKIERTLLVDAVGHRRNAAMLRAALELGVALDASVVAKGIETPEQLALARSVGCDMGQGFLFAPPLDATAMQHLLNESALPWSRLMRGAQPTPTVDEAGPTRPSAATTASADSNEEELAMPGRATRLLTPDLGETA